MRVKYNPHNQCFISEELQRKGYSTFPMLKFSGYLPLKFL